MPGDASVLKISGVDGLPENITADPNCSRCNGHGVLENSEASLYCFVPTDCSCVRVKAYT